MTKQDKIICTQYFQHKMNKYTWDEQVNARVKSKAFMAIEI